MDRELEKQAAAEAAADLVEDRMTLGLGTGSTVAYLLAALARGPRRGLRCVATSPETEAAARRLGLEVAPFGEIDRLDLAIDGADQVAPDGWLIKGAGAAQTREKVVAASAERFVVIVDSTKPVEGLTPPVPLELLAFGLAATLQRLGGPGVVVRREAPPSPDGGVIADFLASFEDPGTLAGRLGATPGVIEHGLFPPELVSAVIVGRAGQAEELSLRR